MSDDGARDASGDAVGGPRPPAGTVNGGSAEPGSGIVGMRERCGLLGGELTAGPRPRGGFEVRARLPLAPAGNGARVSTAAASTSGGTPIKVLLADDQVLVRSGFKVLLDAEDDITVVGEAANGAEAVERARATRPDVVLMDIRMPELDGIKATSEIVRTRGLEQVRVLILTTYDADAYVFEALQAGASGFLLKDAGPAELLHAIRVVAAGEALLAPRITRRLIAQFTAERIATQVAEDRLAVLTQREREVLALVGQGLSNDEIGAELFLSPATARTHVSHAMAKLGARDRAQLVVIAYQTGLVSRGREGVAAQVRPRPQPYGTVEGALARGIVAGAQVVILVHRPRGPPTAPVRAEVAVHHCEPLLRLRPGARGRVEHLRDLRPVARELQRRLLIVHIHAAPADLHQDGQRAVDQVEVDRVRVDALTGRGSRPHSPRPGRGARR